MTEPDFKEVRAGGFKISGSMGLLPAGKKALKTERPTAAAASPSASIKAKGIRARAANTKTGTIHRGNWYERTSNFNISASLLARNIFLQGP